MKQKFSVIHKGNYIIQFMNHAYAHGWEMRKNNSFAKLAECMHTKKFTNYSDYSEHLILEGITSKY